MSHMLKRFKVTQSNHKLALGSLCLMGVSLFLIFASRYLVSHLALLAVLNISWTPEALGAFTAGACVTGYALMIAGAGLFVYLGVRSKFSVDRQQVKVQSRRLRSLIIFAACGLMVISFIASAPLIKADATKTTGYYLATPSSEWDYLLGNYTTGNVFAIRGSDWANMMTYPTPAPWAADMGNYTKVWQDVLAAVTYGRIVAKEVAFPVSLISSIPANVEVVVYYQGNTYKFANPATTTDSPYTVEASAVKYDTTQYTAKDSDNRILWSSTNGSALMRTVLDGLVHSANKQPIIQVNDIITLDSPVVFRSGDSNTTIKGSGGFYLASGANCRMFDLNATSSGLITNINIEGLTFDGNKAGQDSGTDDALINMYKAVNIDIIGCTFKNYYVYGIWQQYGSDYLRFLDNNIYDGRFTPFKQSSAGYSTFSGNTFNVSKTFQSTGTAAIYIDGDGNIVTENHVFNNEPLPASPVSDVSAPRILYYGIVLNGKNNTAIGNDIHDTYHVGILAIDDNNVVIGNTVEGCGEAGIAAFGSTSDDNAAPKNIIISKNTVENNGHIWVSDVWIPVVCGGIRAFNTSHVSIENNIVVDNYPQGVFISNGNYTYVKNNIIQNSTVGVNATASSNHLDFSWNDITNCTSQITYDSSVTEVRLNGVVNRELTPSVWVKSSSTYWGTPPADLAYAVDNNVATYTSDASTTTGDGATVGGFCFDMGAVYAVQVSAVATLWSDASYVKCLIYYSQDNSTWSLNSGATFQQLTATSAGTLGSIDESVYPCRYIALVFTDGAAATAHVELNEVYLKDTSTTW